MSFRTYRDINLTLNGKQIFANTINLNQQIELVQQYNYDELSTQKTTPNSQVTSNIVLSYYMTGKDFLKDFIDQTPSSSLTGNLNGLSWNKGYLQSYSINGQPNSPVVVNATIIITDKINGSFSGDTPSTPPNNISIVNFNDCLFSTRNFSEITLNNVTNYSWNYNSDVKPIYYQKDTGVAYFNADRVYFGPRRIDAEIICDSEDFSLDISGQKFAIDFDCRNPYTNSIYERYSVSGRLNKKAWNISENDFSKMSLAISQEHTNYPPSINLIETVYFSGTGYLLVHSPNFENGFFSMGDNLNFVEKVYLEDKECEFSVERVADHDVITAYVPYDAINGFLRVQTSKGTITYPSKLTLNFPQITISGFTPETGKYLTSVKISGSNFYRISRVLFGNVQSELFDLSSDNSPTGYINELIASVPKNVLTIDKITIESSLRNRSGVSTGFFYPEPYITGISPATGIWSGAINILGYNFTGISNVLFNEIPALSFGLVNNNLITGRIPGTGAGYTKGYIKVSGVEGMTEISDDIYQPIVPIYEISTNNATVDEDFIIYTTVDTGFLYEFNDGTGGYKVFFGKNYHTKSGVIGRFFPSGSAKHLMTGLIPRDTSRGKIAFYEPDGTTLYPPYTGEFQGIGPAPILFFTNPKNQVIPLWSTGNLTIEGEYLKDFFGIDWFFALSGASGELQSKTLNIQRSLIENKITAPYFISGLIDQGTGFFNVLVRNNAGTGILSEAITVTNPFDYGATTLYTRSTHTTRGPVNLIGGSPFDGNTASNWTTVYTNGTEGSRYLEFQVERPMDIIRLEFNNSFGLTSWIYGDDSSSRTYTHRAAIVNLYDAGLESLWTTGEHPDGFIMDYGVWKTMNNADYTPLATGIKYIRLYPSGVSHPIQFSSLSVSEARIYGTNLR